jgi:hypothetical protein
MEQARRGIHGDLWSREGAKILHPTPPSRELPHPFPLFPPEGGQHADPILLPPREFLSIFFLQEKCLVSLQAQPPSHSSSSFRCSPPPRTILLPASASPLAQLLCRGWGRPPRRRNGGLLPQRSSTEVRTRRTAMKKSRTSSDTSA